MHLLLSTKIFVFVSVSVFAFVFVCAIVIARWFLPYTGPSGPVCQSVFSWLWCWCLSATDQPLSLKLFATGHQKIWNMTAPTTDPITNTMTHPKLRYQCNFDSFDVLEPLSIFLIGNSFETLNQVSPHKYISSANYWTPLFNFLKLITPPFLSNHQVHGSPFVLQLLGCDLVEGLAQLTVWYEKRWSR